MESPNIIENDVVSRAQAGDEIAARQIIEKMHQPMQGFIYRMLGPHYRGQMDDLAPGVFLKGFRALQVFEMRERQGMEYPDIARRMGVAEGTVKSRLHRARLALREVLADLNPSYEAQVA